MNKKYIAAALILLLAVFAVVFGAVFLLSNREEPPIEIISSSESESEPEKPVELEIVLPPYDGVFSTLENGDYFYTPHTSHSVTDPGRTVLYYNNILIAFTESGLSEEELKAIARSIGGETVGIISGAINAIQIRVNDSNLAGLEILAAKLMENEKIIYACAEYPVQIMSTETDSNPWGEEESDGILGDEANPGGNDWWAEAIGAYTAWEYSSLCGEIRIGIADNGFNPNHEDLLGKIHLVSAPESNTPADHGTLSAGIIGANNNDIGIRGISDFAELYCADLWPLDDPDSYHTMAEYLAVINIMAQNGVKVLNNSWGCYIPSQFRWAEATYGDGTGYYSEEYAQWVENRLNRDLIPTAEYCIVLLSQLIFSGNGDMLMVQAAGNGLDNGGDGFNARSLGFFAGITEEVFQNLEPSVLKKLDSLGITYDDIDKRILIVGSVINQREPNGNYYMATFSNFGETVDICAPGVGIYSTLMEGYGAFNGTSLSAPMVTAAAAYLWALEPELSVSEVRSLLLDSAPFSATGFAASEGWSYPMLNLGSAVKKLLGEEE